MKWTTEKKNELIRLKVQDKKSWKDIGCLLGTTPAACSKKFNVLQQQGMAPSIKRNIHLEKDEILAYYKKHGARKTIKQHGHYSVKYLSKIGIINQTHIPLYEDKFLNCDDRFYWAGFIAADGCIKTEKCLSIGLAAIDVSHLEILKQNFGGNIYWRKDKSAAEWISYKATNIIHFLNEMNITKRKSKTLMPPDITKENDIRRFIRGYFDGDGGISKSKNRLCCFFLGTQEFLTWIRQYLIQYVNVATEPSVLPHKSIYMLRYSKKTDTEKLFGWLYQDSSNQNRLIRKYDKWLLVRDYLDKV